MTSSASPRSKSQRRLWFGLGGGAVAVLCLCVVVGAGGGVALYLSRSQPAAVKSVEYVLDASPRMSEPGTTGAPRLSVASGVLADIIKPADPAVISGLRVFGSGAINRPCQDTSLVVPLGPSAQGQIAGKAAGLQAGQSSDSALAQAIVAAMRDLASKAGTRSLVVVTGGADSCSATAEQVVADEARRSGMDLEMYVVGFGVSDAEAQAVKVELDQAPKARYLDAKDQATLRTTLQAVQDRIEHPATARDPGGTAVSLQDGMALIEIPAGMFLMGSTPADAALVVGECGVCNASNLTQEQPQHSVYLDGYWIDQTDVTNAMFAKFVQTTAYQTQAEKAGTSLAFDPVAYWVATKGANWHHPHGPGSDIRGLDNHPVVQVTWNDAKAYCAWAGRRLPTEAEWEKAARGTDGRKYPWGNSAVAANLLNFADTNLDQPWAVSTANDGYHFTSPVGAYPAGASPYGALDMVGNVWNWAADWYDPNYYASSPSRNPTGPASGQNRVERGGSWGNLPWVVRTAYRYSGVPDGTADGGGFRCAR